MGQDRAHPVGERPARGRDHDQQVAEQSRHREGTPRGHGARDHRRDGGRTRPGSARRRLQRPGRLPVAEPDLTADGVAVDRQHPVGHAIGAGREQPRKGRDHRRPVLRVGRGPGPRQRRAVRGGHHHRSAFRLDRLRERQPDLRRSLLHDGARLGGAGDEGGVCRRRRGTEDHRRPRRRRPSRRRGRPAPERRPTPPCVVPRHIPFSPATGTGAPRWPAAGTRWAGPGRAGGHTGRPRRTPGPGPHGSSLPRGPPRGRSPRPPTAGTCRAQCWGPPGARAPNAALPRSMTTGPDGPAGVTTSASRAPLRGIVKSR